jgi:hypothetical protein
MNSIFAAQAGERTMFDLSNQYVVAVASDGEVVTFPFTG